MTHRASDISIQRRRAANIRWALEPDILAATLPGRRAAEDKFVQFVIDDLGRVPPPDELAARVKRLKSAHFARLALKSAEARRAKGAKS